MSDASGSICSRKILIIGFGSIGARHARVAAALGWSVSVLSRREKPEGVVHSWHQNLASAIAENPDMVIIATETGRHLDDLRMLSQVAYSGPVLVEKPLFSGSEDISGLSFERISCAYVLRVHPLLVKLKSLLEADGSPIAMMHAYCGQHLADWRPGEDYRTSYSASRESGGGVLRDLSHELDYVMWLMQGRPVSVLAQGGNLGLLGIDSDESWAIQLRYPGQPSPNVTVTINYLDRPAKRFVTVGTKEHSYQLDFVSQKLFRDGLEIEIPAVQRDDIYRSQLLAFARNDGSLCSLKQACDVVDLIEAVERSEGQAEWTDL
ncbi:Gfo/Idh/MocA family protein [Hoeflea sp.]|uniref:Gfo/Idh/MocA family protein n=1 Tax=Hoeflea sp. TaxID=1940281 RepID=UPI003BB1722F